MAEESDMSGEAGRSQTLLRSVLLAEYPNQQWRYY